MSSADTAYQLKISNKLWMTQGYTIVRSITEAIGSGQFKIVFQKNEKGRVKHGKPVIIVFNNREDYVQFRLTIDLNNRKHW